MTHKINMFDGRIIEFSTVSEMMAFAAGFNEHMPGATRPSLRSRAQRKAFTWGQREFENSGSARLATEAEALTALARLNVRKLVI
jgi:hypothetical protein